MVSLFSDVQFLFIINITEFLKWDSFNEIIVVSIKLSKFDFVHILLKYPNSTA